MKFPRWFPFFFPPFYSPHHFFLLKSSTSKAKSDLADQHEETITFHACRNDVSMHSLALVFAVECQGGPSCILEFMFSHFPFFILLSEGLLFEFYQCGMKLALK